MKKLAVFVSAFAAIALISHWLLVNENSTPLPPPPLERSAAEDVTRRSPIGDSIPSPSVVGEAAAGAMPSAFPDQHLLSAFGDRFQVSDGLAPLASTGGQGSVVQFEPVTASWPVRVERDDSVDQRVQLMVANRVLILPSPEASTEELEALAARLDARFVPPPDSDSTIQVFEFAGYADVTRLPRLIETLNDEASLIAYAEPDFLYRLARVPNDPEFRRQRAMDSPTDLANSIDPDINAVAGWDMRTAASSQIVAVIDTGIQLSNPDLSQNLWTNPRERSDGRDSDNNGYVDDIHGVDLVNPGTDPDDDDGHGTAVAGLIGAQGNNNRAIAGVAWSVQLMAIRIFGREGYASTSNAVAGIEYAIRNGANIINASWGGDGDSLALKTAIRKANTAGVLFVTSAGNEAQDLDISPLYPASYDLPNLIAVASTTRNGDRSDFSNWGSRTVHIAAPGEQVLSLSIELNKIVDTFSGTSFSAPLVTGIAALAREEFGPEPPETLKRRIIAAARTSPERPLDWVRSQGYADLDRVLNETTSTPLNDDRANAIALTPEANRHLVNTLSVTTEGGEPLPDGSGGWGTLWYTVAPAFDKPYTITLSDLAQNATIRFFRGASLASVTPLEIDSSGRYKIDNADSGTLFIQVASKSILWFEITLEVAPSNDDFANAINIVSEPFVDAVYNLYATVERGEPFYYEGISNSTWWKYTAKEDGPFFLSTEGSNVDTTLRVFQGDRLESLSLLASNDDAHINVEYSELQLEASKDANYYFQVKSDRRTGARIFLRGQVLRAPRFLTTPVSVVLPLGSRATLHGTAIGPKPITYQWLFEGEPLAGATSNSLVIESVDEATIGEYALRAFSPSGEITSPPARVSLFGKTPQFALHPASGDYRIGSSPTLFTQLADDQGASYQWFKDGDPILGATGVSFKVAKGDASSNGIYHVKAINEHGAADSRQATLFFGDDRDLLRRPAFEDSRFDLVGIADVNGTTVWFAVRDYELWRSTDGFDWEQVELLLDGNKLSGDFGGVQSIEFGNGRYFVAFTSSWAIGTTFESLVTIRSEDRMNEIYSPTVKFIDGYFYAHTSGDLVRSTDGIVWENTSARVFAPKDIVSLRKGGPYATIQSEKFLYSEDMTEWVERPFPVTSIGRESKLISDGSRFIAFIDDNTNGPKAYATQTGSAWTLLSSPPLGEGGFRDAVYTGERYILLVRDALLVSRDFKAWEENPLDTSFIESIVYRDGILFADSSVIGPTRLFGSVAKDSFPPVVLPIDMKSAYRPPPGETLSFSVEARGVDAALDRVEFRVDGVIQKTLTLPPYEYEWTTGKLGIHTIEAVAYDRDGDSSFVGSIVTVIADQLTSVSDRNNPKSIRFMADAFGTTYAVNGSAQLYRFAYGTTWLPSHKFAESSVHGLFVFRDALYVAAENSLYRSKDGLRWELVLQNVRDATFYPGDGWLIVAQRKDYVLTARYTVDGDNWIVSSVPDPGVYGAFGGNLICAVEGSRDQIGLLAPGRGMEAFSLPPGVRMSSGFTDGSWYYVLAYGVIGDFGKIGAPVYRTRTFTDWEKIAGPEPTTRAYSNGLYRAGITAFSTDGENWFETDFNFDDVVEIESGYIASSEGKLLYSANGHDWETVLVGYANVLRKTVSGYFAWTSNYGGSGIYFSTDGRNWTTLYEVDEISDGYYTDMAFGNGTYIAVGSGYAYSTDAHSWIEPASSPGLGERIVFGNGLFLATTENNSESKVATSIDGREWSYFPTELPRSTERSLAFLPDEGVFILYDAANKQLLKSRNGEKWEQAVDRPILWAQLLDNCLYLFFEDGAKWYFSRDCRTWTETEHSARTFANGDYYTGNLISSDGVNWRPLDFIADTKYNQLIISLRDGSVLMPSRNSVDGLRRFYKVRHGALEDSAFYGINPSWLMHKAVNGHNFVLGFGIKRFTTQDLQLSDIRVASSAASLKVGDSLSLRLRIRNSGMEAENIEGLTLQSRLASEQSWTDLSGYALGDIALPGRLIPAGAERELTVSIPIPKGTRPGSYSLLALVNPELTFDESTLANNHAWDSSTQITIPSGSLTVEVVGNGEVTCTPKRDRYALGDVVLLTALPKPKHRLKQAFGSTLKSQNLYAATIELETSVRFEFEEAKYVVKVSGLGEGSVAVNPVQETYSEGELVTLTAIPGPRARFRGWSGGFESPLVEVSIPVRSDLEVIGVFGKSYSTWAEERFSQEQLHSGLVAGEAQDSDNDGISNLWEYLTGGDPLDGKESSLLSHAFENGSLVLRFGYSRSTLDYSIVIQSSPDAVVWTELANAMDSLSSVEEQATVEFAVPLLNQNALFFRLNARPDIEPVE